MRKNIATEALIVIMIFAVLVCGWFHFLINCTSKDFFHDLTGEWQCDEISYVGYPEVKGERKRIEVRLFLDDETIDITLAYTPRNTVCDFYDTTLAEEIGYTTKSLVWVCSFRERLNGELKVKVRDDYRYNGRFKEKVFYLKKVRDDPSTESVSSEGENESFLRLYKK